MAPAQMGDLSKKGSGAADLPPVSAWGRQRVQLELDSKGPAAPITEGGGVVLVCVCPGL